MREGVDLADKAVADDADAEFHSLFPWPKEQARLPPPLADGVERAEYHTHRPSIQTRRAVWGAGWVYSVRQRNSIP